MHMYVNTRVIHADCNMETIPGHVDQPAGVDELVHKGGPLTLHTKHFIQEIHNYYAIFTSPQHYKIIYCVINR